MRHLCFGLELNPEDCPGGDLGAGYQVYVFDREPRRSTEKLAMAGDFRRRQRVEGLKSMTGGREYLQQAYRSGLEDGV